MPYWADEFSRADGADVGANWDAGYTAQNAGKIVSNAVLPIALNVNSTETFNAVALPDDQYGELVIKATAGADAVWLCLTLRMAAPPDMTMYQFCATRNAGGVTTQVYSSLAAGGGGLLFTDSSVTWAAGDTLRAEVQGSSPATLRVYRIPSGSSTQTLIGSATDSLVPTGSRAGFQIYVGPAGALTDGQIESMQAGPIAWAEPRSRRRRPGRPFSSMRDRLRRFDWQAPIAPAVFRKTLSPIGTRTGSRQGHNSE